MKPNKDEIQEAIDVLDDSMGVLGLALAVQDGTEGYDLVAVEWSPITLTYPGDTKDQAMGHALSFVEKFEDGGLSVEREYHGVVEERDPPARDSHAISLHLSWPEEN